MTLPLTIITTDTREIELEPRYAELNEHPATSSYVVSVVNARGAIFINVTEPFGVATTALGPFVSTLELDINHQAHAQADIFVDFLDGAQPGSYESLPIRNSSSSAETVVVSVSGVLWRKPSTREELRARVKAFSGISREIERVYKRSIIPYVSGLLVDEEINYLLTTTIEKVREDFATLRTRDPAAGERLREASINSTFDDEEAIAFLHRVYPSMEAVLWYRIGNDIYYTDLIEDEGLRQQLALGMIFPEGRKRTGIDIDPRARIGRRFVLDHGAGTVIGRHTQIGDDCYLLHSVNLGAGPARSSTTAVDGSMARHPIIGDRVTIFGYATVLGGIRIGNDCQIGTRCLVTEPIPDGSKVRIVNQYQIVSRVPSESGGKIEIFGLIPKRVGEFEVLGQGLPAPQEFRIVDHQDLDSLRLRVNITAANSTGIAAAIHATAETVGAMRRYSTRTSIRDELIHIRLKMLFADANRTVIYITQAAGLRAVIESVLHHEGLFNE